MRTTPEPICGDCKREGPRGTVFCVRCGGEMVPVNAVQFYVALAVAAIPMAVTPAVLVFTTFGGSQYDEGMNGDDGYLGLVVMGFVFTVILGALAYGGVCAIIGYVLMGLPKRRSLGLGVVYGVVIGMVLGAVGGLLGLKIVLS